MTCSTCHADVHLARSARRASGCHADRRREVRAARFDHETAKFPLTGKHQTVECVEVPSVRDAAFPAGTGTAKRLERRCPSECRTLPQGPAPGPGGRRSAPRVTRPRRSSCSPTRTAGWRTSSRIPRQAAVPELSQDRNGPVPGGPGHGDSPEGRPDVRCVPPVHLMAQSEHLTRIDRPGEPTRQFDARCVSRHVVVTT